MSNPLDLNPLLPMDNLYPSDLLFPSDGSTKGENTMISFTDKRLYARGTCIVNLYDPCTMKCVYSSNKFQTGNITTSASMNEIRAGLGNSIATMLPSDSSVQVEFTAADFNLYVKAAQLGAAYQYEAPVMICETKTVATTDTGIELSRTAVAPLGYETPVCYVQEVGETGTLAETGTAYQVSANKVVYAETAGKTYRLSYYVQEPTAELVTIGSIMDPKVLYFVAQIPVYANENCDSDTTGNRVGWLYTIVPRLKLNANGGVVGDQNNNDTTIISGQAIAYDSSIVSATCNSCEGTTLAYYVYVADSGAENIVGLAVVGGTVSLSTTSTAQIPVRFVMKNGQLVTPTDYGPTGGFIGYAATGAPNGTAVSSTGLITSGTVAGDFDVRISYSKDGATALYCDVDCSVVSA